LIAIAKEKDLNWLAKFFAADRHTRRLVTISKAFIFVAHG
jgi:hypothetical protein